MKKFPLSLTAWLLSLTALLLSAMLLTSCGNQAEKATSPKVYYGTEETLGSSDHPLACNIHYGEAAKQYEIPLEDFTLTQAKG